ncbi:hypothetical protein [Catellatospora sichuanensis]|uniref:hypothetical protein n=1 Tax=Catellatospora sichuanensis TaxID=1969805 RepID=UPI0011831DF0|nr:hypothetical protein [Catellatospora sichuanensis]
MSSAESPTPLKRTSAIVTIVAAVVGTVLAYLSLAAAVKWPPFQEGAQPKVTVFRGDNPRADNCSGSACAYIGVQLDGFAPGSTVHCTFDSADGRGVFGLYVTNVDEDGSRRATTTNYYGRPEGWVSATCGDATGALNPWGGS